MKNILFFLATWLMISNVYAGTGFYVTINNLTNSDALINYGGNDHWYCNDFCSPYTLKSKSSHVFYTEAAFLYKVAGIQGIDIDYNNKHAHVEFWIMHSHSVSKNIKWGTIFCSRNHGCYTTGVGTNFSDITTDLYVDKNKGWESTVYVTLNLT